VVSGCNAAHSLGLLKDCLWVKVGQVSHEDHSSCSSAAPLPHPVFKINPRRCACVVFEVCGWSSWLLHHIHILDQGCTKPG
jgi:hypothetical protein